MQICRIEAQKGRIDMPLIAEYVETGIRTHIHRTHTLQDPIWFALISDTSASPPELNNFGPTLWQQSALTRSPITQLLVPCHGPRHPVMALSLANTKVAYTRTLRASPQVSHGLVGIASPHKLLESERCQRKRKHIPGGDDCHCRCLDHAVESESAHFQPLRKTSNPYAQIYHGLIEDAYMS